MAQRKHPSKAKAKKMLKEDKAHGKPLTKKQKRYFGLIAGGGRPTKMKNNPHRGADKRGIKVNGY